MEWVRNLVANRLAANGTDWPALYALHNSGAPLPEADPRALLSPVSRHS